MPSGYREASLVCPGCGERLDQAQVEEAILDVCSACGGVWIDWFDGDLATMARGAPRVVPVDTSGADSTKGPHVCPRCHVQLRDERCGECAGVFVPRSDLEAVAAMVDRAPEPAKLDAMSRLALTLQRWLGWKDD